MSLIPTTSPATIAFVLDNIAAYETILSSIDKETQVFVIDSSQDALQQMATIASGFSGLDAVHVFSHGSSGSLDFGQTKLTNTTLSSYAPQLLEIGSSLSPNGDILLYGCSVAEGQMGVDFMGRLSEMTGTDIAASDDATGSVLLGGDMVLERSVGSVEAEVLQVTINTLLLYELESNNTLATATTSTLGTAMLGQLSSISDVDYFKYTVGSSGILSISYDDPINDYESAKISVYNSAGALLTSQSGSYDISVSAAALSAGDYYVTVSNSYGSGQYSLTTTHMSLEVLAITNQNTNNTLATATTSTLGTAMLGQLSSISDVDYFKYTVGSSGILSISYDDPINDYESAKISVYNSAGALLTSQSGSYDISVSAAALSAGDYYVTVSNSYGSGQYSLTTTHVAGSVSNYESESNNTLATATTSTLGTAMLGQLSSISDVDYFKYTVGSSGILSISYDDPINDYESAKISVYNSAGALLTSQSGSYDISVSAAALSAGDYYVTVSNSYGSGQYSLTTTHVAGSVSNYESESNNTLATATTSTLGTAMLGQLSSISDVDYFKYTVGSSGILSISYDDPINDYESAKISVYNSAGALLTSQSGSYDISVSAAALSAGDYYVTVSNSYGSGQYSLTTTHVAGSVSNYESESNNTLATATTSTLGTAMLGQLSSISDVDYFKYTVGSSGILSISYDDPINDYESAKISVYNSAGALLTSQSGSYDISVSAAALSAGDYYVTVSNSYGSGQYSLTTTHVANNTSTPELEIDDDLVDGGASDLPALQFSQSIENGEIVLSISTNEWSSGSNTLNFTLNYDSSMGNFDRYETGGNGAYSVSSSTTVVGSSGTLRFNSTINNYGDETDIVKLIFTPTQSNTNLTYTASSIYVNSVNYGVVYLEDGINTAPTITSNSTGSVAENAPITTVIYDANATDVDVGTTLSYSLSGTDASLLNINSSNGEVTLKTSADYETKNSYIFNVLASDGSLSDTKEVTVAIANANEAPTITSSSTGSVAENAATATVIYDANATDVDAATTLSYSLSGTDASLLNINSSNGEVTLKTSADYETKNSYSFNVIASDGSLSDIQAVTVAVTNMDETQESETAPEISNILISVNESLQAAGEHDYYEIYLTAGERYLFQMNADGLGAIDTAYLELYKSWNSLFPVASDWAFGLGSSFKNMAQFSYVPTTSGTYIVEAYELGDDSTGVYSLKVALDDYSINQSSATQLSVNSEINADINTMDEYDYYKVDLLAGQYYMFEIDSSDNNAIDTAVLDLYDPVSHELLNTSLGQDTAQILYHPSASGTYLLRVAEQSGGIGTYKINSSGGTLDTQAPVLIEFEITDIIDISSGNAYLEINTTAQDDLSGVDEVMVWLDSPITIKDAANTIGAFSSYSFFMNLGTWDSWSDGHTNQNFVVSSANANGTYNIRQLEITDFNGNKGVYSSSQLKALGFQTSIIVSGGASDLPALQFSQSIENGEIVLSISTNEWSSGSNTLNFTLNYDSSMGNFDRYETGGNGAYSVSSSTTVVGSSGTLRFNSTINNYGDETDIVKLIFTPIQSNTNLTYTASSIYVNSVNYGVVYLEDGINTAPTITSNSTGSVAENAPITTVIYDANATDVDAGTTLSYSLSGTDASLLNINSSNGEVTLKASADYETKNSYSFNVVASDGSLSDTQAVTVTVTDVDETPTEPTPEPEPETIATRVSASFVESIQTELGVSLNMLIEATMTARLRLMIENNTYSKLAASIAIQNFSSEIREVVGTNQRDFMDRAGLLMEDIQTSVETDFRDETAALFASNNIEAQTASTQNELIITLAGLTTSEDTSLNTIADVNALFGTGTIA